jgi:hypothetical protein
MRSPGESGSSFSSNLNGETLFFFGLPRVPSAEKKILKKILVTGRF